MGKPKGQSPQIALFLLLQVVSPVLFNNLSTPVEALLFNFADRGKTCTGAFQIKPGPDTADC